MIAVFPTEPDGRRIGCDACPTRSRTHPDRTMKGAVVTMTTDSGARLDLCEEHAKVVSESLRMLL